MSDEPYVIGAALRVAQLGAHLDWLFDRHRDLEIQDFFDPAVLDGDWKDRVQSAKRLLDGFRGRLGVHGPFYGLSLDPVDDLIRAVVQKRLDQGLDICAELGATQMVLHSPYSFWDHNNLDDRPGARAARVEDVHRTLDPVVRRAEALGVVLVIENIEDIDPGARRALAESFGAPAIQVSIDTGHAHYAHCSGGAPPVDYFVRSAGDMLAHVHLQDADGYADRHWGLGRGTVNWPAFFEALRGTGATPHLVLELKDDAEIASSMRHLQSLGLAT
ncbi:MAG: sugar phosphate isomerase/epimerase family protein [Pseudomonadota bacterium]